MQGTRKIVKRNISLDNIMYVAINASGKSTFETEITVFLFVLIVMCVEVYVCVIVSYIVTIVKGEIVLYTCFVYYSWRLNAMLHCKVTVIY